MKEQRVHASSADVLEPVAFFEEVKADAPLQLVIHGGVRPHAGRVVTEVVAAAMVSVARGKKGPDGTVLLRFAADPCDLAAADADFPAKALRGDAVGGFALQVDAERLACGDLLDLAARGSAGATSPLAVTLRQVVALDGRRKDWVSAPIRGFAAMSSDPFPGGEPSDALPFLFDCHSHWYSQRRSGRPTRYWTVCHGPCPTTTCHCATVGGRRFGACEGWTLCWC